MAHSKKAFTLIEVIIAMSVLTVVLVAMGVLTITAIRANQANIHRLTAYYLAQEGLEGIRNIRDSNVRLHYAWNTGESFWGSSLKEEGFYTILYKGARANAYASIVDSLPPASAAPWRLAFYGLDETSAKENGLVPLKDFENIYTRVLQIDYKEHIMEVTAIVSWKDREEERSVKVSTEFTDWNE